MSMIRSWLLLAGAGSLVVFGACVGSDYQGGGRRDDLGTNSANGISLSAAGAITTAVGGTGGEVAGGDGLAGFAGCAAGGVDNLGLAVGCTP